MASSQLVGIMASCQGVAKDTGPGSGTTRFEDRTSDFEMSLANSFSKFLDFKKAEIMVFRALSEWHDVRE